MAVLLDPVVVDRLIEAAEGQKGLNQSAGHCRATWHKAFGRHETCASRQTLENTDTYTSQSNTKTKQIKKQYKNKLQTQIQKQIQKQIQNKYKNKYKYKYKYIQAQNENVSYCLQVGWLHQLNNHGTKQIILRYILMPGRYSKVNICQDI